MLHAAHARSRKPAGYRRRTPEHTVLHQVLSAHFAQFLERANEQGGLPKFVVREIEEFLRCGLLEHGCVLLECRECGRAQVVAFSCKRRGFCPSCCGRRMNDAALHLTERVIPKVPIRQYVCSLPWQLRTLLGYDRVLCAAVLRAFVDELGRSYKRRAKRELGLSSVTQAQFGAVSFVHRFDSALKLNVHVHTLALDGVYTRDPCSGQLQFNALGEPSLAQVHDLAERTAARIEAVLIHCGRFMDPEHAGAEAVQTLFGEQPVLGSCYQAAASGLSLAGEHAGQPTLRLVQPQAQRELAEAAPLCAEARGVNIHASAAIDGRDRPRLLRLCRYIARPPLSHERLSQLPDGRLQYTMKKVWRDGTHAIVFDPLSFISRLVALVPPPRFHLLRYAGILSPAAKDRAEVVGTLAEPQPTAEKAQLTLFEDSALHAAQAPAGHMSQEVQDLPEPGAKAGRQLWAVLLRKTFAVDVSVCVACAGRMRVLEFATTPNAVARALYRAGLGPQPPPAAPKPSAQLTLVFG